MKKLFVIGIAAMMVMGVASMVSASDAQWTVYLNAGKLSGQTWSASQGGTLPASFGVDAAAATGFFASLAPTTAGIYGVNPDANKMANKDIRVAGQTKYVWDLKVQTGTSWVATDTLAIGIKLSSSKAIPAAPFKLDLFREGTWVKTFTAADTLNSWLVVKTETAQAGAIENWQLVASSVPEPGSIVAMLSGLVGLAGYGIRRRK